MVAGIILFSLGVKKTLPHAGDALKTMPAVGLCGGVAIYFLAHVAFRLRNIRTLNRGRLLVGDRAARRCIPVATEVDALASLAAVAALSTGLMAYEFVHFHEARERLRHALDMTDDPDHHRPRPARLARLPEQFFTGILAAAAAAPAQPGRAVHRPRPRQPRPAAAAARDRGAARRGAETATPAVHGYPPFRGHADAARGDRRSATAPTTASSSTPTARSPSSPGRRPGSCSPALATARRRATPSCCPTPATPTTSRASRWPARASSRCRCDADDRLPARLRRRAAGERVALAVLNYPSNPCAVCEAPGTFEAAVAFARERGAWLLHDLAYGFLAFDGRRARSVLEVDGARDVAIELWSPSKIYGMAGWRIGFAVGAPELVARIQPLLDHAGRRRLDRPAARAGGRAALRPGRRRRAPRDLPSAAATAWSPRCARRAPIAPPEGSFYAWWRLPDGADRRAADRRGARRRRARRGLRRARRRLGAPVARGARRRPRRGRQPEVAATF